MVNFKDLKVKQKGHTNHNNYVYITYVPLLYGIRVGIESKLRANMGPFSMYVVLSALP